MEHTKMEIPTQSYPIFILTSASLFFSILMFFFSMLDLGFLSLLLNPIFAFLTIIFHITILNLTFRRSRTLSAALSVWPATRAINIGISYFLSVAWLAALILKCIITAARASEIEITPALGVDAVQIILDVIEFGLMLSLAIVSTRWRRRAPNPREWISL